MSQPIAADIPGNFKRKFVKKEDGLICKYCEEGNIMSQSHCMECSAWSELRRGLDLSDIGDLVEFFRKMLDMAEDVLKRTASHNSCQDDCWGARNFCLLIVIDMMLEIDR